ncbi:hypothetical protein DSO57_1009302 [Entomophthora muscae]|uniref:Uncharacterized protein n=1 Tax=Entomophthora muscae TaxID=34485 RepID=A0ACC2RLN6_9FUNG|nr:hypothetical protein DSO57_1009302 [Entomophthora muscae]
MCLKDFRWQLPKDNTSQYSSSPPPKHCNIVLKTFHAKAVAVISRCLDCLGWEKDIARIFSVLDASELLIDLRDSSGLHMCGSNHILNYLFPGKLNSTFPLSFPDVPLVHKLLKECKDSKEACSELGFASALACEPVPSNPRTPFDPSQIKVVTNGICSGACAALLQGLLEVGVTKVYFVGPIPSTPLVNTRIPYSLAQLRGDLFRSRMGFDESAPPSFLTTADLHFSFGKFPQLDGISPIILNTPSFLYNTTYLWRHILQI